MVVVYAMLCCGQ